MSDRWPIDTALVRRLVDTQFPQWTELPLRQVLPGGNDNRTFRLGDHLSVRLPSAQGYAAGVAKEQRWLPVLAPRLPLPIPGPVGHGAPAPGQYPFPWSVYAWLDGHTARVDRIDDLTAFAVTLAEFLLALRGVDPTDGPLAGEHSFYRGTPLAAYDDDSRRAIAALGDRIDGAAATKAWEAALDAPDHTPAVWFHGDVAETNLLTRDGRLAAVIDFGTSGVGDPACDLVIAWTLLFGASRRAFRAALGVDDAEWERGRGWALWKALITVAEFADTDPERAAPARRVLDELLG